MSPAKSPLPVGEVPDRVRDLLEDFEVVGTTHHVALIKRSASFAAVRENVRAALVASTLDLASVDYAKRQYCNSDTDVESIAADPLVQAYISAFFATKAYVEHTRSKLRPSGLPEPSAGVFTAAMVLERLPASFFCAHFLYRIGHRFEGHAISRLILEQIAWAYAAHSLDQIPAIEGIEAHRAISNLKRFAPEAGLLYGFLSAKTHIKYSSHLEFLSIENGKNVVWHAHPRYSEFAEIILVLGDLYGLIWELSQFAYISNPEAVELKDGKLLARADRPFLAKKAECLAVVKEVEQANESLKGGATPLPRPLAWR